MSPERLQQVEELYHAARERRPKDRAELLALADPELRREVESLLAQNGENLLDGPVMEVAAKLLDDSSEEQLEVGSQLGPYKIESSIGAGGMGQLLLSRKLAGNFPDFERVLRLQGSRYAPRPGCGDQSFEQTVQCAV